MAVNYQDMTDGQKAIIYDYCKNDMKKLKLICNFVWGKKGLPSCYHDDLYGDAMDVLSESVITFDPNGKSQFKTYLTNNIRKSYKQWYRDNFLRAKRNNLELDENRKIKRDEKENPIIIHNVSFDVPINDEEEITLQDVIKGKNTVESEIFGEKEIGYSKKMERYLCRLSNPQKEVLRLISIGFTVNEILNELNITKEQYDDCYNAIHSYRNMQILL